MKKCPECEGVIRRKVVPKETFPVNVLPRKAYLETLAATTQPQISKNGAFCPWCGHELIELLPKKRSSRHSRDSKPMVESRSA